MKIAVVTGASSGMGRETIIQLWEHFKGFDEIWIIARRRERLDELDRQAGVPLRKFALDLTRERDVYKRQYTMRPGLFWYPKNSSLA